MSTPAPDAPDAPVGLRARLGRWPHLVVGLVLVGPTLALEGLLFLILVYCGTYGAFGPVIGLMVVTLPVALPGAGAWLDRRRRRAPGAGPAHPFWAVATMVAITAGHLLLFYLVVLAGESTSGGEC